VKVRAQFDNADDALFSESIRQRAASGEDAAVATQAQARGSETKP
jgi:hypothetical protein